ncbi:MAG: hypothetical protein ACLTF2_08015 [Clostridia bacterium]
MDFIKEEIVKKINELGFKVGTYDKDISEIITKKALKTILENLQEEYTDVYITIRKKLYIVSISTVNNEKDILIYKDIEYFRQFGNLEDAFENEDITEEQYNRIKKFI